jgi:hypothetical protein
MHMIYTYDRCNVKVGTFFNQSTELSVIKSCLAIHPINMMNEKLEEKNSENGAQTCKHMIIDRTAYMPLYHLAVAYNAEPCTRNGFEVYVGLYVI